MSKTTNVYMFKKQHKTLKFNLSVPETNNVSVKIIIIIITEPPINLIILFFASRYRSRLLVVVCLSAL